MTIVQSGIAGFDQLFNGGVLAGNTILVEGAPGAGKTTMGIEFIYRGAKSYGEPGVVLTFEQFPASLYRDALNFGWDLQELERERKLKVICTSPELVLMPESNFLEDVVREIGAQRVLVDSMSHFRQAISHPIKLRQSVYAFGNGLRRLGLTAMLIKEKEQEDEAVHGFEEFLVDAVVRLGFGADTGQNFRRTIEVTKSRGQAHLSGKHSFKITDHGLQVYFLPPIGPNDSDIGVGPPVQTGIRGIDELLQGGFPRGASILVSGGVGTGKTVLGMEFLASGASRQERGLFVSFEEKPGQVAAHAEAFDWNFAQLLQEGWLKVNFIPLDNTDIDEFIYQICNYVSEQQIKRLVFDSLPDLIAPMLNLALLRKKLFCLISYLNNLGCTTLLLYPTVSGGQGDAQLQIAQSLVQGNILLKSTLSRNRRLRYLEVYKLRGVSHSTGNHLMEIASGGIQVFPRVGGG